MKIYTKTGDKGSTSLFGGTKLSKGHIRIETYGTVDELNSHIGLVRDQEINTTRKEELTWIQDRLFTIGSLLATEAGNTKVSLPKLNSSDVGRVEKLIDQLDEALPPMKNFVLPGGHQSVSFTHIARTVCRRSERMVIRLNEEEEVDELIIPFLNRLSDYLFVLARKMSHELKADEAIWKPQM